MAALIAATMISGPAWAEIGRVKASAGAAAIQRGAALLPARPGLQLEAGDTLVTRGDGRISITFIDDTRFAVGPNSRIALSRYQYDRARQAGTSLTRVDRGSLAVVSGQIARSGRDAMTVRTPTSLLGVRGTRFVVRVP